MAGGDQGTGVDSWALTILLQLRQRTVLLVILVTHPPVGTQIIIAQHVTTVGIGPNPRIESAKTEKALAV